MKYLCLIYHDEAQLAELSHGEYEVLVEEVLAYNDELRQRGHFLAASALEFVHAATSIRVRSDTTSITDGPFVETKEQLGGYVLIEARDLNEAIRIASQMPTARWGGVEVRPVKELRGVNGRPNSAEW